MPGFDRGAALIDVVVVCGLTGVITAMAVPMVTSSRERDTVRVAAHLLASRLAAIRLEALKRNVNVALRFDPEERGVLTAYVDGDGDGVLQRDVDAGVDLPLGPSTRLSDYAADVGVQIARDVPMPDDPDRILPAGSDPVRIGATTFLSYGPLGGSTSGSVYIAAREGPQMCVRVLGATGRIRVMWFDTVRERWRP
jgi:hypothetical protein